MAITPVSPSKRRLLPVAVVRDRLIAEGFRASARIGRDYKPTDRVTFCPFLGILSAGNQAS
jgi:hypothetical protein